MFDPKYFEEIAKKLLSALPDKAQEIEQDLQEKFKMILQASFAKLDLVTREEFDVQAKVLARTREKIENLQRQVTEILKEK